MPSYRKDKPSGDPARPSGRPMRQEPEEDEPREPRSFSFRQEPRGYASRPVSSQSRDDEFWDVLVPKSERDDPHFDYSKIFDVFAKNPSHREAAREAPRERFRPERGPERGPEQERSQRRQDQPVLDPSLWFDMNRISSTVAGAKRDPRFRAGSPIALVQVARPQRDEEGRADELIRFFRIPESEVRKYPGREIWPKLIHPFLDELAYALNSGKPREFPGRFLFQEGKGDGSLWLAYLE